MAEKIPGGRALDTASDETWQQLGTIGSRLGPSLLPGQPTRIRNCWLQLDVSPYPMVERAERLVALYIELGAPRRRVSELVEHAQTRASRPGAAAARLRSAEQRARLSSNR
jgi:hypothetical protein